MNQDKLWEEKAMTENYVIEGMQERSLDEIIEEVANEENLTPEEVREMVMQFQKDIRIKNKRNKNATKPVRVKNKNKIKQAKKSKKQNRKR